MAVEVECLGCQGLVPDVQAPSHAYMQASPGCWQVYTQLVAGALTAPGAPGARWHHVDCYAVQHPGGARDDRRQRQSVAVHLVSLCLLHEFGQPPDQASARRSQISQRVLARVGLHDWPYLPPPANLGAVIARDVHAAAPGERAVRMQEWASSAWAPWSVHHDAVRAWAAVARADRR